jgi:hypothetical protein
VLYGKVEKQPVKIENTKEKTHTERSFPSGFSLGWVSVWRKESLKERWTPFCIKFTDESSNWQWWRLKRYEFSNEFAINSVLEQLFCGEQLLALYKLHKLFSMILFPSSEIMIIFALLLKLTKFDYESFIKLKI